MLASAVATSSTVVSACAPDQVPEPHVVPMSLEGGFERSRCLFGLALPREQACKNRVGLGRLSRREASRCGFARDCLLRSPSPWRATPARSGSWDRGAARASTTPSCRSFPREIGPARRGEPSPPCPGSRADPPASSSATRKLPHSSSTRFQSISPSKVAGRCSRRARDSLRISLPESAPLSAAIRAKPNSTSVRSSVLSRPCSATRERFGHRRSRHVVSEHALEIDRTPRRASALLKGSSAMRVRRASA